jgi:orotate phosphoribosyltransferase
LQTLSFPGTKTPCGVELKVQLGRQAVVLYIGQMETKRGVCTIRVSTTAVQRLMPDNLSNDFIRFAIAEGVLCFGEFKTKAGRLSPYFFNAGLFSRGAALHRVGQFYACAILAADVRIDMLFGPAYKGIPLVAAVAIALAEAGHDLPFAYNRKEAKDHGEGGIVVGTPLAGRVLIVDDVISAGTSVRESVQLIRASGAIPAGLAISLDRMERGQGELSATQEVTETHAMPVISIANLDNLVDFLSADATQTARLAAVARYRSTYGVQTTPHLVT